MGSTKHVIVPQPFVLRKQKRYQWNRHGLLYWCTNNYVSRLFVLEKHGNEIHRYPKSTLNLTNIHLHFLHQILYQVFTSSRTSRVKRSLVIIIPHICCGTQFNYHTYIFNRYYYGNRTAKCLCISNKCTYIANNYSKLKCNTILSAVCMV